MFEVLAGMVRLVAQRSTCARGNNGAIIFDDRGVSLRSGYNGALAGQDHCEHPCTCGHPFSNDPSQWHLDGCTFKRPCRISLHAEANAILWAAREGIRIQGASIICTTAPCFRCSQMIAQVGISQVFYLQPYRLDEGLTLLKEMGVTAFHYVEDEEQL